MATTAHNEGQVQTTEDLQMASASSEPTDHELRAIMKAADIETIERYGKVFYQYGKHALTVKAAYWDVALATDDEGNRFLTESELDRVFPRWRHILNGKRFVDQRWPSPVQPFVDWLSAERRKACRCGKPWPRPHDPVALSPSPPTGPPSGEGTSAAMSRPRSDGDAAQAAHARASSSSIDHSHEPTTRALRELVAEVKELKEVLTTALQGNLFRRVAPAPQVNDAGMPFVLGPIDRQYYGVPEDAQEFNPGPPSFPY